MLGLRVGIRVGDVFMFWVSFRFELELKLRLGIEEVLRLGFGIFLS